MSKGGRDDRRAAALRANLQRRKAQARGRADVAADPKPDEAGADRDAAGEQAAGSGPSGQPPG